MAKNTAIPVLKNAKSAEDLEKYLNGMEDKDVLAFYDETQKIQEDQAYRYEEQLEFLEEYMVERKLKEAKPQEQQPKSEMAMGAELYKRAKGLLDSGEQLELSDDELQLLRKYLERMHESLADHTVENYVAEHFPLTVEAESQEEPTITREEQLFNHAKAKFNNGEELDLSPDEVYNIQMHILRMHNYSSYNQEENAAFEQKISQIGKQYFDGKHPDLIEKGVSTDIDDIYYLHMYMERFGIHNTLDFHHTVDKQIREQQGEDAPTLSGKIRYDILRNVDWEDEEEKEKNLDFFRGFSSRERKPTLDYAVMQLQVAGDGEDREEIQNLINILSDQKTQEQQTVENQETAENVVKEPVAEATAPAPQAEQTEELQPEPVRESPTQENPTIERKPRTPQQLLEIAMGPNRLQSIEDAMTTQELISLHKHIGNLRPKRDVKLSKKEANDLHIRSSIDRIVLHTLGVKLITPPYQELKDIEKSGEQFLLRDVFRHYQQEDKSNELHVEKALEALNDERHKRGLENLEYRFEYLGMPKNKRPNYQQFLFDKFYEMPTEEVLESIGISNLYTLRKNMEKYLASHEADDNKKTFLNLQINQAINSHRATEKQEKKRRQQEANLPIIEAVYNDIKEHALEGNMTEVLNILQRLQPNQLGLVVQMEQYAAEQVKNEQNEEVKAKLEEIDGHISARISELREERNKEKATEQEDKTPETVAETTEQENKATAEPEQNAEPATAEEPIIQEPEPVVQESTQEQHQQSEEDRIKALYNHIAEVGWHEIPYEEQLAISNRDLLMLVKYAKIQKENARGAENYDSISSTYIDLYMQGIIRLEKSDYENNQFITLGSSGKEEDLLFLKDYIDTVFEIYPTGKNNDEYLAFVAAVNTKRAEKGLSTSLEDEFNKLDHANDQESVVQNAEPATQEAEPIAEIETEPQVQPNIEQENTTGGTIIIGPASPDTPIAEPVPESEPIIIGGSEPEPEPEPENRVDLYEDITPDNIYDLVFEEPEVIKQALDEYTTVSLHAFRSYLEKHISEGHINAQAPQLETFYNIAVDKIIKEPKFGNPDTLNDQQKEEVKTLLEIYSVDFTGKPLDNPVYGILMERYDAQPREATPQEQIIPTPEATPTAEPQSNAEENILNAADEDTYSMLEQIAKDVFDGYGHFYEAGFMDQPRNRMVRLNRFFENVDIEHDKEWRNIGDTLRQLSNRDTYQKYDGYTAEVLKYELLELARQNAINEILNENEYDGQGNFLNELGQPIFQDDLKEKIQEKVLDHMEESVITLMLSQAQKENNDRLLEGLEKDENGQLTAQGLEDFQKRALDEITEIGNRDTSRNLTEKIKDFVAFWQNKDETKHKFTIYDSVAFSVVKERCSQVHEDIKNLWNKFTSKTKVGAFASKLYERNKQFNEKLAKDHPVLNTLYQYGKGIATSLLVGAVAAKTAPVVMTVYCAAMSAKAVKSVYNGYKEYKKQNEENNFWNYCKNNKVQVFGTALVATGTAVGIGADALNGAHFNWANISKGSRLSGAIMMGANSALEEAKKGNYGVAFTRFMTTATTVFLGTNNANASNENVDTGENVNTIEAGQPEASNISNEIIEQANKDVENYAEHITLPNEITDSLNQNDQQSSQTTVSEDIDTESSTSQENQQETNNNTEQQHHNNSEKRDVQAKSAEQIEAERQEAEIASIKESVKFEVPDIEKESDTFADNSSSSASVIGDFTNASEDEVMRIKQIIASAENPVDENILKNEGPELSSDDNTGRIETEPEKSVAETQKTTEEIEAQKDESTYFPTAADNGLTGEALYTHTSGDTAISVYENGFFGVETKDGEVTQTWNIRVDADGKPFGSIHTATGEKLMTPQQLDYYNRLTTDYLMQNDNPAKDQVFKLYGDIDQAIHPKDDNIINNQNNETKVTNIEGNRRATLFDNLNKLKADNGVSSSSGSSYDDFIKNIEEQSYLNSRPYNAEVLEQKYGLVRPAAIQEQSYNTHSQVGNNVMNTRSFYSLSRAENGFSITDLDVTKVMVIDADNQAHLLISNGDETPHEMNPNEAKIFLKTIQNNISKEEDIDVYYKVAGTYLEQHPELTENTGNNVETPTPTDGIDLTNLHIIAATERATEFGLTGGDTRLVESGQYQGTVVTKAENGWQIRYPEGNSIILKVENGTLSGMFVDTEDKTTNMKPQEVEQYRQAAADAYKNSQTPYGKTSADIGARSGGMSNRGNSYT